ncbi:MAG: efflux system, outer rane lipoprotein, NodT family [bacterium]|nr:efflux system, outer rane lipoprotein, NodT family [bacterium]
MRATALITLLLATSSAAQAETRRLSLQEAVQAAMHVDPLVSEAHIQNDRARLGVLRAQLDRFSLKVDGSVQELWNKTNIGGPTVYDCMAMGTTIQTDAATCTMYGGVATPSAIQQPSQWTGLSNFQANANYYLFSGFRVEANVKRAKATEQASLVQVKQQRKDTALAVARAYWNVRRLMILRDVQQSALQRMIDAEAIADGRLRAGLAPPIDKNRATQRKLAQMGILEDLLGQARTAAAQLGVALGIGDELELVDEVVVPEQAPASPAELVRDALGRRPELQNAKLQVEVQHQNVRIARSNFFPQLTLFGLFQYGNNAFNVGTGARSLSSVANPFSNLSGNFTGGVQLTMNFFDTLNTYTATADAHYLEEVNKQEVRRFERLVDSDVRAAYATLLKLYARRVPLTGARDVARDNLTIVEGRYKNGDALIIEYLDAQIDLANAELNLADVTAQLQLQWYELQAALGYTVGVDHG